MTVGRTIVVGDVHGMLTELVALLEAIDLTLDDTLVMAGDLVDKGPASVGVVQHVRGLRDAGHTVVLVQGNHEDKHTRFRAHEARVAAVGVANPMKDTSGELAAITGGLGAEDVVFLESAVLHHRFAEFLVVHAGIEPRMVELPTADLSALTGKAKKAALKVLRTRHVNPEGRMVELGKETDEDVFWAETYDGRFGHVLFGHEPFLAGVVSWKHATALDTGAVFGGALSAAIHTEGEPLRFASVASSGSFAKRYKRGE